MVNSAHAAWNTRHPRGEADDQVDPEVQAVYDETDLAMHISQAIFDQRTARGWTQSELAARAGMHQGDVARLEHSLTLPSTRTLFRIASALEVNFSVHIGQSVATTLDTAAWLDPRCRGFQRHRPCLQRLTIRVIGSRSRAAGLPTAGAIESRRVRRA